MRVILVEASARPGGTVADCLIHTLGGLYDSAGTLLNGGLAAELATALGREERPARPRRMGRTWVLEVCPDVYRAVVQRWLAAEARLQPMYHARVVGVDVADDHRIRAVLIRQPGQDTLQPVQAVIDATGTAEVVRLVDSGLVEGGPPRAAGGLILRLRGVAPGAMAFPRGVAVVRALRTAAEEGALPAECGKAWLDSGTQDDEAFLKLFVPLPEDFRCRSEEIRTAALGAGEAILAFLRRRPDFAGAHVVAAGRLGVREAGRIRGEYVLTRDDVLSGRQFADAACRCAWPIEHWDVERGVSLDYSSAAFYEVPLRALRVRGRANLWAAGKCLSADIHAQSSARVAGCCWSMGEAVGKVCGEGQWQ
jgi:hypothetical protein